MERDEVYVPKTRSDLGIPQEDSHVIDYDEFFADTPIFTLYMLIRQQLLAFPAYLCEYHIYILHSNERAYFSLQCIRAKELSKVDQPF
jgi:hypothetical protein